MPLASAVGGPTVAIPDYRFHSGRPGQASVVEEREANYLKLSLRSHRQISVGNCVFSEEIYQGFGPGHAAFRSTNPSKPIAPDTE
jgi:hypothetical protein